MAICHLGSFPDLCIVCCKGWSEVAICPSLRIGRRTCSWIFRALEPSQRNKRNISFLRKQFRKDCRRVLEDLVSTIFSTIAARSPVGQGLSCFCHKIIIGGDNYSVFYLFGHLLDGLLDIGWVRGSEIEPAEAEFHSFVREQLQVEVCCNRSRVPINSVFGFWDQPGFRFWRNLHKVSVVVVQNHLGVLMT